MTENAYMTDVAWLKVTIALIRGYRDLPFIKDNPGWLMFEPLDGFGSHERVLEAHEMRTANNIISAKEESASSHCNQAYDKYVARNDKKVGAETLASQRALVKFENKGGKLDQYDLVHTAIMIVKQTPPATWITSYEAVNLHPTTRLSFPLWCKKITPLLQAGQLFKPESVKPSAADKYALLPEWWWGMTPSEKAKVTEVVAKHEDSYCVGCLRELHTTCSIPYAQMNDVRVCIVVAREFPDTLKFGAPGKIAPEEMHTSEESAPEESAREEVEVEDIKTGLDTFQIIPKHADGSRKFTGDNALGHVVAFRNREVAKGGRTKIFKASAYLDLEVNHRQMECVQPTEDDFRRADVLRDAVGDGAMRKISKRKLTTLGYLQGHCGIVNSKETLKRMKQDLDLSVSVAEIHRLEALESKKKKAEEEDKHKGKAPAAALKLEEKKRNLDDMYVKEMICLLFTIYNVTCAKSVRKPDVIRRLKKEMNDNLERYTDYVAANKK